MSESVAEPADQGSEVIEGRRPPFSLVGDWVMLSGASHQAVRLYWIYRMHANQERGDNFVWPKRRDLADIMGFKQTRMVDRYNRELQALGAIDIRERWVAPGVRGPNLVTVHLAPPPGYGGVSSLQEFYHRKRAPKPPSQTGGSALECTGGSALQCTGGSALECTDNQTKSQPEEESIRRRGDRVPQPQNVDSPLSETMEKKDDCLHGPQTTETTQYIRKEDGPLTRQDHMASDLQKPAHALASLACAAAPPLRGGLPPKPRTPSEPS